MTEYELLEMCFENKAVLFVIAIKENFRRCRRQNLLSTLYRFW